MPPPGTRCSSTDALVELAGGAANVVLQRHADAASIATCGRCVFIGIDSGLLPLRTRRTNRIPALLLRAEFPGVLVESRFAGRRAEVIRSPLVFALSSRTFFVDLHLAHGIRCHGILL